MLDFPQTWLRRGALVAAAALAFTLGGCAGEPGSSGDPTDGSSSADQPNGSDSPTSEGPAGGPEGTLFEGLDSDGILGLGIGGKAEITCGYTFDEVELGEMSVMSTHGWVSPEATIHLNFPVVHWEIPQDGNRMSHIVYYDNNTYMWKTPGDNRGVMGSGPGDDLSILAEKLQRNAHDCVAFTGPDSVFSVPADMDFIEP